MSVRIARPLAVVAAGLALVLPAAPSVAGPAPAGVPAPAGARGKDFRPGAPGLGDPYYPTYGNGGYDVQHYDLAIRYQPRTDQLTGRAVIRARATQDLSRFNLDLLGLTVDKVRVDGRRATFSRNGQELIITPARGLARGHRFTVVVRYHGVPRTAVLPGTTIATGFMHTDDGAVVAGQPEVAAFWYPVNDHPLDKATYSFAITVPAGLEAICNGIPRGSRTRGGWTTWRWVEPTPMNSYLATATIGQFRLSITKHHGRPMVIAVDEALPPGLADDALSRTGEITDFLAERFGPYPFSSNGGIVDSSPVLRFALENQTRTVYAKGFFDTGATNAETYVVVHELAHQWFGDSVSVRHWDDLWLNEGFATYAEWMWSEHLGEGTPQERFDSHYAEPLSADHWSPKPGDPGTDQLFDDSVYKRGAMTLHALRMTIGDADFDRIVRRWYALNRNGHGSTEEFIRLAERVSGEQLDELFQDWLFTDTKPPYPGASGYGYGGRPR